MPDEVVRVEVVLKDGSGREVDRITVDVPPGNYRFDGLSPGNYVTTLIVPDGYIAKPPNLYPHYVPEGLNYFEGQITKEDVGIDPPDPPDPPETPQDKALSAPALITLAIGSMLLIGNLGFLDPFISTSPSDLLSRLFTNRSPPENPSNPSESPGSSRDGSRGDRLSPEIQARLRDCLKAHIDRVLQVPSLSELATALMGEDKASITETQRQVRDLYKSVKQLYDLINECDPSFIQALLDTEDPKDSNDQDGKATDSSSPVPNCVMVIAERVNIRAAPSSDSAIIAQALFGTSFQVDQQSVASLSERQRLAMKMGEDWYPVILPDGNRGYIFSRYVTAVDQQRQ